MVEEAVEGVVDMVWDVVDTNPTDKEGVVDVEGEVGTEGIIIPISLPDNQRIATTQMMSGML